MDTREFICLSEDGDRTIIVGEAGDSQRLYKVDSRSMAMASPIWKAMFSTKNGFRESNPNEPVEFPEDDAEALLILLRIIHYRFHEVPKELPSFECLLEIAVLCDKYDVAQLVRPFIEGWMRPWINFYLEPGYEHWLFIAWTFGCQEIFDTLASALVLRIEVHQGGKIKRWNRPRSRETSQDSIINREEAWISDENMPPEIIGKLVLSITPIRMIMGSYILCRIDPLVDVIGYLGQPVIQLMDSYRVKMVK